MTSRVLENWACVIATCAFTTAFGCGGDSKSSKEKDAGPDPFGNANTSQANHRLVLLLVE